MHRRTQPRRQGPQGEGQQHKDQRGKAQSQGVRQDPHQTARDRHRQQHQGPHRDTGQRQEPHGGPTGQRRQEPQGGTTNQRRRHYNMRQQGPRGRGRQRQHNSHAHQDPQKEQRSEVTTNVLSESRHGDATSPEGRRDPHLRAQDPHRRQQQEEPHRGKRQLQDPCRGAAHRGAGQQRCRRLPNFGRSPEFGRFQKIAQKIAQNFCAISKIGQKRPKKHLNYTKTLKKLPKIAQNFYIFVKSAQKSSHFF